MFVFEEGNDLEQLLVSVISRHAGPPRDLSPLAL